MKVPLVDLSAHHAPIQEEILKAIEGVFRSQAFILGSEVQKLEERISSYCRVSYAIGVSSGTDALLVSLMALGIQPGDEVITTPYSFFATAGVITRLGARPVFVDIDPATYNMKPAFIARAITPRTRAIFPVHLFGQCAEMHSILEIAQRHHLPVVEDAAQAIGAEYLDGHRAGSFGALGCFSFFPSKNLGALGDGGMVVTSDPDLAERVRLMRNHGAQENRSHRIIGGNFRLDALQAAVLNVKLDHLDVWTEQRQNNAQRYILLFKESGLVEKVGLMLPKPAYELFVPHFHTYNQFVIRVPDRDRLREHLLGVGIATGVYYPVPFHLQDCFKFLGYRQGDFPEAEKAARETIALPVYPGLSREQQVYVVDCVKDFFKQGCGTSKSISSTN